MDLLSNAHPEVDFDDSSEDDDQRVSNTKPVCNLFEFERLLRKKLDSFVNTELFNDACLDQFEPALSMQAFLNSLSSIDGLVLTEKDLRTLPLNFHDTEFGNGSASQGVRCCDEKFYARRLCKQHYQRFIALNRLVNQWSRTK
jgi:hypothetical protein